MSPALRVYRIPPDIAAEVLDITNDVAGLQGALGGYMEPITLPPVLEDRHLLGLVDEEGLLRDLLPNPASLALGRPIVGPLVIVRVAGEDFTSLDAADIQAVREVFW